jgi:hypothetical protein
MRNLHTVHNPSTQVHVLSIVYGASRSSIIKLRAASRPAAAGACVHERIDRTTSGSSLVVSIRSRRPTMVVALCRHGKADDLHTAGRRSS